MQKPIISNDQVQKFLLEELDWEISSLQLLAGGGWSQAYSFIADNKKYVVRVGKSRETYDKDQFVSKLNDDIPTPTIYEIGSFGDNFYAISEFSPGRPLEEVDESGIRILEQPLLELLASIRSTDLEMTIGYGGWNKEGNGPIGSWQDYLHKIVADNYHEEDWWQNLESSSSDASIFEELLKKFKLLIKFTPNVRELIHADLLNKNLLVSEAEIAAVIDWQCSVYGDSLYELAWFAFNTLWYPQIKTSGFLDRAIEQYKLSSTNTEYIDERMLCYQLHIGLDSIKYNSKHKRWDLLKQSLDFTRNL